MSLYTNAANVNILISVNEFISVVVLTFRALLLMFDLKCFMVTLSRFPKTSDSKIKLKGLKLKQKYSISFKYLTNRLFYHGRNSVQIKFNML